MDDSTKLKVKAAIDGNPHLFSARHNRDYLTIGIEIAAEFPDLVQRVNLEDGEGNKFHADMVPIADVRDAMRFAPPKAEVDSQTLTSANVGTINPGDFK